MLRIGTQERDEALQVLGEHFAQGRLPVAEYDERVQQAVEAATRGDLRPLFADLPPPHPNALITFAVPPMLPPPMLPPPMLPPPTQPPVMMPPPPAFAPHPYAPPPASGPPYEVMMRSPRYRAAAGLLQLLLPFGAGRFYTKHTSMAVAQLLLTMLFGVGVLWCWIDGII